MSKFQNAAILLAAAAAMLGTATNHVSAQDQTAEAQNNLVIVKDEAPVNFVSMLMWRVNSTGGDFTILGPAMNQVLFIGDDCNNNVDLKKEFDFPVSYSYSDGASIHNGITTNPEDAKVLEFVCWVVMAEEPMS